MDDPQSKVERVKLKGRETSKELATVDDLIVHRADDGGLILEFVCWGADQRPLESFRITACPEDAARIRYQLKA